MMVRIGLWLLGLTGAGLALGFAWFVGRATYPLPPPPAADGIVVLTGGSNRIEAGLRLLASGKAPRLLISGVLPGTAAAFLARESGVDPARIDGRVTLGQSAISTRGNAEETAAWVRQHGVATLIVVTAYYHMPRALAELHRSLPRVTLYPAPVRPARGPDNTFARRLELLGGEYLKYLAVRLGLPSPRADLRTGAGLP